MRSPTLLSLNNYHYHRGGAEAVFLGHNKIFSDRGWHAVPFCMHHPRNIPSPWSNYFVDEIELGHEYSLIQKLTKVPKTIYSFEAQRKVARLIQTVRPDVCHAHNVYHHISPSVFSTLKSSGVPVILTLHDLKLVCPAYKMLNASGICEACKGGDLKNVVRNKCIRNSTLLSTLVYLESELHRYLDTYAKYIDRFVSPSRFFREKLSEWGVDESKITLIPNFLDPSVFEVTPCQSDEFVYVGRLAEEKGVATLIKAVKVAGVRLRVLGDGPESNSLRQLAAHIGADVTFSGFMSSKGVREAISSSRAMVLPSEWYENAPISILEAYAIGRPVIASRIGGLTELVQHEQTGLLFDAGSVSSLATALQRAAALSFREINDMGMEGRAKVEGEHSPQTYYERTLDVYRESGLTV